MRLRWFVACVGAVFLLGSVFSPSAAAENVQVTAGVGDTTIRFSGWTAPFAFVTLMENSVVVGTTTAGADGRYVLLLVGQTPGIHNFRIFSRDSKGRITDAVVTQLNITEHTQTAVSIFLPPAAVTTDHGDSVVVEGSTAPRATVILTIGGKYFKTQADGDGNWRYVIAASDLPASEYHISVAAVLPGGLQSYVTGIPSVAIPPLASRKPALVSPARPGQIWPGLPLFPQAGEEPAAEDTKDRTRRSPGGEGQPPRQAEKDGRYADGVAYSFLPLLLLVLLLSGVIRWQLAARRRNNEK